MTLIKSISGIRGTVGGVPGDNLTPQDVVKFTSAYARWLKGGCETEKPVVVVGRDARLSGEMVNDLVEGTLLGCGIDVVNVGLCTTPGVELAVTEKRADGGIILTASHNPAQWNALKLLDRNGEFLADKAGKEVLALAEEGAWTYPSIERIGRVIERSSYNDRHIERVLALPETDVPAVAARRFRVVVDAVNSVGGITIPPLLERMGVEVIRLNCDPSGCFAHNPEPIPEHLEQISEAVVREHADLGVVVDPDVDRLALVDENGKMFGEEYTLVAVADYVLSLNRGGNTVSNLSSSRALSDITARYGGSYAAAAVGEVNVVAKMKEIGAVIGGEGNGGVIFPRLHYGRDALVGAALFLSHLARSGKTVSALRSGYPSYFISKNKIQLTPQMNVDEVLQRMKERYASERVNDIDGVKIDFPDEWVHLRKSNTEPIIRIYSESRDEASAQALAGRIIREIETICNP